MGSFCLKGWMHGWMAHFWQIEIPYKSLKVFNKWSNGHGC
jgi:hypothetical protein